MKTLHKFVAHPATAGGLLFNGSCKMLEQYPYTGRDMFETWHIFGDAATYVWTKTPMNFTTANVTDNGSSITVNAGVSGSTICASSGNNGASFWQRQDNVSSYTFNTSVRPLYITISKHNYVPYSVVTGGNFTSNEYWLSNLKILGNVKVNAGVTLTVNPGAVVKFNPSTSLTVNGVLNANGTPTNKVTFTSVSGTTAGSWGSIILSGSSASSSTLNNLTIRYGTDIQFLNSANATLQNSLIEKCTRGVYIDHAQPRIVNNTIYEVQQSGVVCNGGDYSPCIGNNVITKTSSNPLYMNYQGIQVGNYVFGFLFHNDIKGFCWGMYLGGGVNAAFADWGWSGANPNNRIKDCYYGVGVGYGSMLSMDYQCGSNSIFNNSSYNLYVYQYSYVSESYNYWGVGNPKLSHDCTSSIYSEYRLTTDPWPPSPRVISESNGINSQPILFKQQTGDQATVYGLEGEKEFAKGRELERQKDYTSAIAHFKQMVESNKMPRRALAELALIGNQTENNGITTYFESLKDVKSSYQACVMQLLSGMYRRQGMNEKSLAMYDEIINKFPDTRDERIAWFQKFYYALHLENDKVKASGLLDNIIAKYSEDDKMGEIAFAKSILDPSSTIEDGSDGKGKKETTATSEVPTEVTLESYPNPFNPTTVLSYQLSAVSNVKLCIFDMLGREVAVLQDGMKEAGKYSATFDASKLSSGVYFSRLTINPQEGPANGASMPIVLTKKLLLLR